MAENGKASGASITAVGHQLADNPGHNTNTANPYVLVRSRYIYERKIKGALFIQSRNPELNTQVWHKKFFHSIYFNSFLIFSHIVLSSLTTLISWSSYSG